MTELLDQALEIARSLPPARQDEIAEVVIRLADTNEVAVELTANERASIAGSKAAAARGEFATESEVSAVWAKHGL